MASRRHNDQTLSLFAFQDIITGVAGVMLFILLLLVVQLALQAAQTTTPPPPQSPSPPTETIEFATPQDLAKLESLREEYQRLQSQNEALFVSESETLDEDLATLQKKIEERNNAAEKLRKDTEAIQRSQEEIASSPETRKVFESIASLREQLKETEEEIESLGDGTHVSFTIAGDVRKDAWIVDLDRDVIRIFAAQGAPPNTETPNAGIRGAEIKRGLLSSPFSAAQEINKRLKELTKSRTLVVLIRPSDPEGSYQIIMRLRDLRYKVAMELIGAGVDVVPLRTVR